MVVHGDDFIDAYSEALRRAYIKNKPEKGDSWLVMEMDELYRHLNDELLEALDPNNDAPSELADVGLVAAMLWWRENGQQSPYVPPPR